MSLATRKKKASKKKAKPAQKKAAKKGKAGSAKKAPKKKGRGRAAKAAPAPGGETPAQAPARSRKKPAKKRRSTEKASKASGRGGDDGTARPKKVSRRSPKKRPPPAAEPVEADESPESGASEKSLDEESFDEDSEPPSPPTRPVEVGAKAPSFHLVDQRGGSVSSEELSGAPYVLYFYPRDDTPGCTREACGFRDELANFERAGARIVGVSPDTAESHAKFQNKYGLPFTLLSDREKVLASKYGVWVMKKLYGRESMGIQRSTFLIDREGVVRKAWRNVKVDGHVASVLEALREL